MPSLPTIIQEEQERVREETVVTSFMEFDKQSGSRFLNHDKLNAFIDDVISHTAERVAEEMKKLVPGEEKRDDLGKIEGSDVAELYYDRSTGFNLCRSQLLEALSTFAQSKEK